MKTMWWIYNSNINDDIGIKYVCIRNFDRNYEETKNDLLLLAPREFFATIIHHPPYRLYLPIICNNKFVRIST